MAAMERIADFIARLAAVGEVSGRVRVWIITYRDRYQTVYYGFVVGLPTRAASWVVPCRSASRWLRATWCTFTHWGRRYMGWFGRKAAGRDQNAVPEVVEVAGEGRGRFGRRYLANAPYMLPSDDVEINRLDFQHYMLRYALRGNYLAPVRRPRDILDVGCGTGRWAREVAAQFPRARVVGVDIAAPPAEADALAGTAPGSDQYRFVQADITHGLPFADALFDFVHQRLLFLAIPTAQWPALIGELARVTRSGGWVELVEGSAVPPESGPAMSRWGEWLSAASARRGIDFAQGGQIGRQLTEAGLAHVRQREVRMRAGRQFGRLGTMLEANYMGILAAVRPRIVAAGLTTGESYDATVAAIREEIAAGRCSWHAYIAYGRRGRG